jgi:hypothetical protein
VRVLLRSGLSTIGVARRQRPLELSRRFSFHKGRNAAGVPAFVLFGASRAGGNSSFPEEIRIAARPCGFEDCLCMGTSG